MRLGNLISSGEDTFWEKKNIHSPNNVVLLNKAIVLEKM